MSTVTIRLFGAFRDLAAQPEIAVEVPPGAKIADLRLALGRALGGGERALSLLSVSAIADAREILDESAALADGASLAVLPPVCGGWR
jgi:molybdopterin converting factor small subunit